MPHPRDFSCLPQFEFDGDFHNHINRLAEPACRRNPPLLHGGHRPIVQPAWKPVEQPDVADAAIATYHNLENHFAFNASTPRLLSVVSFDFLQNLGRCDAAARAIRAAAHAAARSVADAGAIPAAESGSGARSHPAAGAGPTAFRMDG